MKSDEFRFLSELVHDFSGIVLDEGKRYLVESRLAPCLPEHGIRSFGELVARLQEPGRQLLAELVVDAMTTNETLFFRDPAMFDALRNQVLPRLVVARDSAKQLRLWCGASATGQEPYSIAVTIREAFPELASWDVTLLATDLSRSALARAEEGVYSDLEVRRGLDEELRDRYFIARDGRWVARQEIRRLVTFRNLNLVHPWPNLGDFDVVFLRNVLIYFDAETKKGVMQRVRKVVRPDGYLFLAATENPPGAQCDWVREPWRGAGCLSPRTRGDR